MQRFFASVLLFCSLVFISFNVGIATTGVPRAEPSTVFYKQLTADFVGDWQNYGEWFTQLQSTLVGELFIGVLIVVPITFLLHYLIIGPMSFAEDGEKILFFNGITRCIHSIAALSFTLLVLTGLMISFGAIFGGGSPILFARYIHIGAAIVFAPIAIFMFLVWIIDMLPRPYDFQWLVMAGGYLSKEKKQIPAGKFNAGQKIWFWLATVGGALMAYTGYFLWNFSTELDTIRLYAIIHNFLAAGLIGFFIVHLYMSLFAIKGSLESMKTGYKSKEEVDILHSKFQP